MKLPRKTVPAVTLKPIEVKYLRVAADDAKAFLSPVQYSALVDEVKLLADWPSGPNIEHLDVAPIDEFHELKEKGGIFGKINVRVYFVFLARCRRVYVLGAYKKEQEHQTPRHIVLAMRNRLRALKQELKE